MTELLKDREALAALCTALTEAPWVGLDTEFMRERTYFAELCLIQVSLPGEVLLIDPLALEDLTPLGHALGAPGIKIFHAGRQDLELLLQEAGALPAPLFDTQIAAALIGHDEQIGYANLVAQRLKIELNKDVTRTNWAVRPLSPRQLAYAEDDVRHLRALHDDLMTELVRLGRENWLVEDCALLTNPALYGFAPEQLTRRYRQGAHLPERGQAVFQELLLWRETAAQEANVPRTWLLADGVLFDLAAHPPKSVAELARRRGLDTAKTEPLRARLFDVVSGAPLRPTYPWGASALSSEEETLFNSLQILLDQRAEALAIRPGVICSRRALKEIAQGASPGHLTSGWRAEVLGSKGRALFTQLASLHAHTS